MTKKGLGKGLKALIPAKNAVDEQKGVTEIEISKIVRNEKQPRHDFDQDKLLELAASIKEHGVIQPVIVRPLDNGNYELIAGERRWRAAELAAIQKVPAIVKKVSDKEVTELALIENIQRENLNPIEEAMAFKQLLEDFGLTQEELSKRIGKSRSFIANTMRLLNLSKEAIKMVQQGVLSAGHARALLVLDKAADQSALARKIAENNLSVRQVEQLVKNAASGTKKRNRKAKVVNLPIIEDLEEQIQGRLGTKVRIKHGNQKGVIEIEYYGDEDLHRIIETVLGEDYKS